MRVTARSCIVWGLITAMMLFFIPHPALAGFEVKELAGNIHVGPVRLHPYFSVKGIYTDNLFLEEKNEKANLALVYIPGITIQLPFNRRRCLFQFDYRAEIFRNFDYSNYDKENHRVNVLLSYKSPKAIDINIGDEFILSATPPEFEGDTLDKYWYNEANVEIKYHPKRRYKLRLLYRNVIKQFYEYTELDDYIRNEITADIYYRFLPKTSVMLEGTFFYIDNNDLSGAGTDNANLLMWVGLAWEPGARLKGEIKGGYTMRRYAEYGRDEDTYGMRADLIYFLGNFTTIRLDATREIIATEITAEDDVYGTHFIRTGGSLSLKYTFPFLSYGHHKISAIVKGFYYDDEYRENPFLSKKRRDDRYGGSAEVNFELWERLGFKVMYRYTDNDSNFDNEAYRENMIYGQISLTL